MLGGDHSRQLPPLTHALFQDCIAYALSNQPNVISRKMGEYDWHTAKGWLLSLSAAGAIQSRGTWSWSGFTCLRSSGAEKRPHDTLPTPPACPCQPALRKEPQHSLLSPAWPLHWDIQWLDPFPVVTRRKATMLAWCWAGEEPQRALSGRTASEGAPGWGLRQENTNQDSQPYLAHGDSYGAGQQLHPAPSCWEDCLVGCHVQDHETCQRF